MAKTLETNRDWRAYWSSVAQRVGSEDMFKQVDRTVSGRAVGSGELRLLVDAVVQGLELEPPDGLLDLCCGNGLVTQQFATVCRTVVGIDYSEYLIEIARQNAPAENVTYLLGSAENLETLDLGNHRLNKVCINGGLQYLTVEMLDRMLANVGREAEPATDMMFTDVPDADRIFDFYDTPEWRDEFHRRRAAGSEAIGTWWSRDEMAAVLDQHGYEAAFTPPTGRTSAHYRFDVIARLRHCPR